MKECSDSSSNTQFKDIKKLVAEIVSGRETSIHDERKDDSSTRRETRKTKRMTDQPPVCQQLELVTSISEEADKALLWEHSNRDAPRREATRSEKGIEGQRTAFSQQSNTVKKSRIEAFSDSTKAFDNVSHMAPLLFMCKLHQQLAETLEIMMREWRTTLQCKRRRGWQC